MAVRCVEERIAVFSPHTSWDAVHGGINNWLLQPYGPGQVSHNFKSCQIVLLFHPHHRQSQKKPVSASAMLTGKFLRIRKVLQQAHYLLKNFRIFWKMSGSYTKYPDNLQSRDELEIFHMGGNLLTVRSLILVSYFLYF